MPDAPSEQLRVMSFNIRGFWHQDAANAWEHRAELNIATVRRCAPDLIGFQEVQGGNLRAYHEALPEYHYFAYPWYDNTPPHAYNAIFWRPKRLRPLEADGCWLSQTPDRFSGSWGTDNVRVATWLKFACLASGAMLVHLNTHIDHRSAQARIEGTRLILARLDALQADGSPAIVTGDFNEAVGLPVHRLFTDAGFVDAHIATGCSDDPSQSFTYHGWEGTAFRGSNDPLRRIDWILLRDGAGGSVRALSCEIVRDAAPPLYPSDHFPVVADVEIVAPGVKRSS